MSIIKSIERIKKIDNLVRRESTGTPDEFSRKLGVSKRRLYQLLEEMEELGVSIGYNRIKQTYMYKHPVRIKIEFEKEAISKKEEYKIHGGKVAYKHANLLV